MKTIEEIREKRRECNKRWRSKHPEYREYVRQYNKRYKQEHKERANELRRLSGANNAELRKTQNEKRYWEHRETQLEYRKQWGKKNKMKDRQFKIKTGRKLRRKIRLEALAILGGKCVRCGYSDERALQVDHINGGGIAHRKQFGHQTAFYKYIVNGNIEGLQLLCANCNSIKRVENNEYRDYDNGINRQTEEG